MFVSIVIVGFRNVEDVTRCIEALGRSTHAALEIVVVENGGREAFARLQAAQLDRLSGGRPVRLVEASGNLGFAGGVNLGLTSSPSADAWWVLNPDTVPEPTALAALVGRLERGDCDAAGGVLHFADGNIQALGGRWQGWIGRATSIGAGTRLGDPVDPSAVEAAMSYLLGASALIGRHFLETVGPMREDYFLYAEEIEWFLRAGKQGMRLGFAPDARVLHRQGTTTGWKTRLRERPRMPIYLDERNRILVTRDCFPRRLPVIAVTSLLFMLLRFGRQQAWRQIGFGLAGWLAGLRGARGAPRWHRV